jgi:ribosomal protein S18 acetylase RimI-like enzyme
VNEAVTYDDAGARIAVRRATKADGAILARLIDLAGDGIPTHLWGAAAGPGETALDVGRRRAERDEGGFSFRNATLAECDGAVAGLLLGYRQPAVFDAGDLELLPPIVRPLVELEAAAPGSWYLNALAVLPEFQGRGIGRTLLGEADRLAALSGARDLSIIVASENRRAFGLYQRHGFREVDRRAVIAYPGFAYGGDWVVMVKALAG